MDPRTPSEVEATGTLPLSGEGSVPLTEEEPAAPAAARALTGSTRRGRG